MESRESEGTSRFVQVAGMRMVFQPAREGARKHPCPDCHYCQFCSDCGDVSRAETAETAENGLSPGN